MSKCEYRMSFRETAVLEEGLRPGRVRRPRSTQAAIEADFRRLARIAIAAAQMTPRDVEIIFAVVLCSTIPEAASYLKPGNPHFSSRISRLYGKLKKILEEHDFSELPRASLGLILKGLRRGEDSSAIGLKRP